MLMCDQLRKSMFFYSEGGNFILLNKYVTEPSTGFAIIYSNVVVVPKPMGGLHPKHNLN